MPHQSQADKEKEGIVTDSLSNLDFTQAVERAAESTRGTGLPGELVKETKPRSSTQLKEQI